MRQIKPQAQGELLGLNTCFDPQRERQARVPAAGNRATTAWSTPMAWTGSTSARWTTAPLRR